MSPNDHPMTICQLDVRLAPEAPDEVYLTGADCDEPVLDMPEPIRRGWERHDLIFVDGTVAISVYECCYCMWSAESGKCMGGSLWATPAHYVLTPASHALLMSHAVGVRRVHAATAAAAAHKAREALTKAVRAQDMGPARALLDEAERCSRFRSELLARALRVEANARSRAKVRA